MAEMVVPFGVDDESSKTCWSCGDYLAQGPGRLGRAVDVMGDGGCGRILRGRLAT